MTGPALTAGTVPVGPMLSMFDPIFVGINEFGQPASTSASSTRTCSPQANPAAANPGC